MNYAVTGLASAEQELAALWVNAGNRVAVTTAANQIEALLRKRPAQVGESRSKSFRILFVDPLAITFEFSKLDRLVRVHHVWRPKTSS